MEHQIVQFLGAVGLFIAAFWGYTDRSEAARGWWYGFHPGWAGLFVAYLLTFYWH